MEKKLKNLGRLFWFLKNRDEGLDVERDRHMIIHQVLAMGSMDDVREIFRVYGKDVVREEFQKPVRGLYYPAVLELFEYILRVKVNKSEYIKNIHGKAAS